jgi:hypothetical protein
MNVGSWLLWGFVSTVVLTAILAGSQGLGMTRMNIPYLLGTMFTPNRDRAKLYGGLPRLGFGDVVARGRHGVGPRLLRPGRRRGPVARPASADGE